MIWQKVTELKEVENYANILNAFKVDYLQSTLADLPSYQRDILTGICVITMVGILFTNVTVIICLFKTNQTNNLFFHTILHLCFPDVLFPLAGIPTFIFGSVIKTNSRVLEIAEPCSVLLFLHVSMYIIGLIGVDRFVRIKYYIKHREILTPFRFFMVKILILGLALFNSVLILLNILNPTRIFHMIVAFFDISLIIVMAVLQIKTISSMKTLQVVTESSLGRKIRKLTTKILIAITLLLPPYIVCAILRGNIEATLTDEEKRNLQFIFGITINLVFVNSSTNAVSFFFFFKQC